MNSMPAHSPAAWAWVRGNAIQLCRCDFDGGWAGVEGFLVCGAFDGPVAGAVAFDHSGVGAVSAFAEWESKDFLDDTSLGVIGCLVRGESPLSLRLRGGSRAGIG